MKIYTKKDQTHHTEGIFHFSLQLCFLQTCKSGIIERLDILQDVEKDSEDDSKDAEDIEAEINKFHESCVNILSRIDICSKNLQNLEVKTFTMEIEYIYYYIKIWTLQKFGSPDLYSRM